MIVHNVGGFMTGSAVMMSVIWLQICLSLRFIVDYAGTLQRSVKDEREKAFRVYDPGMGRCSL